MIVATTSVYTFFSGVPTHDHGSDVEGSGSIRWRANTWCVRLITPGNDCIPEAVTGRWKSRSQEDPCRRYKVELLISSQG